MSSAEYMRNYRKTHPEYCLVERKRKRLNIKRWQVNSKDKIREEEQTKVIRWLFNYWKALKSEGMTDKKFIIRFDSYLKSLIEGHVYKEEVK